MKCPNCGAAEPGPGPFCMHCGFKMAASSGAAAPVAPESASTPLAAPQARPVMPARGALELMGIRSESALPTRASPVKTIRRIAAGSVFKVTLVVYALLFGIFGCPLLLVLTSLGSLAGASPT